MALTGIESLLPIKDYISIVTYVLTIVLCLSPIVLFVKIIKGTGKYTHIPPMMFIFTFLNNAIWGGYWYRKEETYAFLVSFVSEIITTIFSSWYLFYFSENNLGKFILFVLIQLSIETLISLLFYLDIINIDIVGIILIGMNVLQFAAPSQNMIKVIKTKNCRLIPIVSTILGACCSGGWVFFGLIVGDLNTLISNGLGFSCSFITIIVWLWIYCKYGEIKEDEETAQEFVEKAYDKMQTNEQ